MSEYAYIGGIDIISTDGRPGNEMTVVLYDINDPDKAPAMLKVYGNIANYIYELYGTDRAERYARKRFTFSSFCTLTKIEVLDGDKIVKTVTESGGYLPFIGEDY